MIPFRRSLPAILAFLTALSGLAAQVPPAQLPAAQPAGGSQPASVPSTAYAIFLRGQRVGTETVTVSRSDAGWLISSTVRLQPPLNVTLRRAEVRYDEQWHPVELSMEGSIRDAAFDMRTTFQGTIATTRGVQAGQAQEKTDTVSPDTVVLPNTFYGSYVALARRLAATEPGSDVRVYVAPQMEIAIRLDRVATERVQTAGRAFEVRRYTITFQNPANQVSGEVWAEADGRLVRVAIPTAQLDVVREDVASVAARKQPVHREGDEDVRVPATGFTLAATISRPRPATPPARGGAARLPAIILVAGSGPMDRDETAFGIPIFGQLAGALADAGFLVIRYDKRGVGQSGGRAEAAALDDYAQDVRSVVEYAANRKDVDGKRIALAGHSEGAWTAMLAAAADKRVARLVMIAGAGTSGAEVSLEQQQRLLDRMKLPETERQAKVDLQKKIVAAVLGKGSWDGIPAEYRKQAESAWLASFWAFDPARVLPRVRQPLLIIQPALDTQVPPRHGARLGELAAARKKGGGQTLVTIDGVNHLLVPATTGERDEYGRLADQTVSPKVAAAIVDWLRK